MDDKHPIWPLMSTDCYKLDHRRQYANGTRFVYSNFTCRGSRIPEITKVVHFGLQAFLREYCVNAFKPFFAANVDEVCAEYEKRVTEILGPNSIGSDHIRTLHGKGYLPLEFKSLPEGSLVPLRVPLFTIENTEPEFFWLVNYIETIMSCSIWQAQTSATLAHRIRGLLNEWANKTGDPLFVGWQGHDFSYRGMSSEQSACYSGAGHLLSFTGTDTLPAIDWIKRNYPTTSFIGGSVAATEHSVATSFGKEDEGGYFSRLLDLYPTGIFSAVADSYDLWKVITQVLPKLKDKIMGREGKLVIRPDSGVPQDIICGDPKAKEGSPESFGCVQLLWDIFGGTINEKGYKVLDSHVGVIYGDSMNYDRIQEICQRLEKKGFASTNVVYGIGSYTYQYNTRDTFSSAIKATWVDVGGEERLIFKDPITDNGMKKSAKGRMVIDDKFRLIDNLTKQQEESQVENLLRPVWRNGKFLVKYSFDEVRELLRQ